MKVCGITTEDDALLAVALGADALGFVFASGSPRQVRVKEVGDIVRRLPPGQPTVGVFRDERPERAAEPLGQAERDGVEAAPDLVRERVADVHVQHVCGGLLPHVDSELREVAGLKLGLTICEGIVKAHGGRIWAEPNLPRGVAFLFSLPVERPQPTVPRETEASPQAAA